MGKWPLMHSLKAGGSVTALSATDAWAVEPLSVMTADIGIGRPLCHNR
jgi:hypothetical protein